MRILKTERSNEAITSLFVVAMGALLNYNAKLYYNELIQTEI